MITEEKVWEKLKTVADPELGLNIVDLGLIYKVEVNKERVSITMTLTFPGCPFGASVERDVKGALKEFVDIKEVDLKITFDPPWDLSRVSPEAAAEIGLPL